MVSTLIRVSSARPYGVHAINITIYHSASPTAMHKTPSGACYRADSKSTDPERGWRLGISNLFLGDSYRDLAVETEAQITGS